MLYLTLKMNKTYSATVAKVCRLKPHGFWSAEGKRMAGGHADRSH